MTRRLPVLVAVGLAAGAGLVGCSSSDDPAEPTQSTVVEHTTITRSTPKPATSSPTTTQSPTSSESTTAESTASAASSSAVASSTIRQLEVTPSAVLSGEKVGDNLFQLSRGGLLDIRIKWRAKGEDGDLRSSDCAVIIDVTGPAGFDERHRSGQCTGFEDGLPRIKVAGTYTAKVSVTPPGGTEPTVETIEFKVLGAGE